METYKERYISKSGVEITIFNDDNPIGSIILSKNNNFCHIGYLGVKPNFRGQGYSSKLLTVAETWAKNQGASEIKGTLIPTPGSERIIVSLVQKRNYQIDKNGNIIKTI